MKADSTSVAIRSHAARQTYRERGWLPVCVSVPYSSGDAFERLLLTSLSSPLYPLLRTPVLLLRHHHHHHHHQCHLLRITVRTCQASPELRSLVSHPSSASSADPYPQRKTARISQDASRSRGEELFIIIQQSLDVAILPTDGSSRSSPTRVFAFALSPA